RAERLKTWRRVGARIMKKNWSKHKRLAFMDEAERMTTRAAKIWSAPCVDASARYMGLMDAAVVALDGTENILRNFYDQSMEFDLFDEAKKNPELHASLDFTRLLLKNWRAYVVEPHVRVTPMGGCDFLSPLEHAHDIE